jgi:peptide/nickel transport system substrate-binding protein
VFNPIKSFEKFLYFVRDLFWSYPDLILGRNSLKSYLKHVYSVGAPYSHFVSAFLTFLFIPIIVFYSINLDVLAKREVLVEAVVMGVDGNGLVQKINQLNPLLPSNIQLEKDLNELIYEPLVRLEYKQNDKDQWDTQATNVLAESVLKIREGADYEFNLRRGVKWHDGSNFTADDVTRTFDLIAQIDEQRSNAYVQALKQMRWEKIDEYTVRICTKSNTEGENRCDESKTNPILSNFLELISIKIIPEHLSHDITSQNIYTAIPKLFRDPVGTGRFKFKSIGENQVAVERNEIYYGQSKNNFFKEIHFIFYKNFDSAVQALQNGEVHSLASVSVEHKQELESYPHISLKTSSILYNQYWALYFNLRKDPNGKSIGPEFLQDDKVRKAISSSISRGNITQKALLGTGEEALSPIPKVSYFFNSDTNWYTYNPSLANDLLNEAGWKFRGSDKFRTNSKGEILQFSLYFVDSYDRWNVAEVVKQDLERVGVRVITDRREQPGQNTSADAPRGWGLEDLNNQILAPRLFDVILYGMNTFIDPDRYELFHSSQQKHPGLNIAGYTGTTLTVRVNEDKKEGEKSTETVSKVDAFLKEAREYDPEVQKESRKSHYDTVQELIAEDVPVVFLYHPQFLYYTNNSIKNVNLRNAFKVEERFRNIDEWSL